jgi:hypothetical protein
VKLWMLTEVPGEPDGAAALVWADDADAARWLLREDIGKPARVCREIYPPKGQCIDSLIGFSASGETAR